MDINFFKEYGRLALSAVISYLLTAGVIDNLLQALAGTRLDLSTQLLISGLITGFIKSIDRAMHEAAKAGTSAEKALLRF